MDNKLLYKKNQIFSHLTLLFHNKKAPIKEACLLKVKRVGVEFRFAHSHWRS